MIGDIGKEEATDSKNLLDEGIGHWELGVKKKKFLDSEEFTINLFTYKIKVSMGPDNQRGAYGTNDYGKQKIWLDESNAMDVQIATFFHEIVHIISKTFSMGLSETQTDCMAMSITSLIKDNPDFIRSLLSK